MLNKFEKLINLVQFFFHEYLLYSWVILIYSQMYIMFMNCFYRIFAMSKEKIDKRDYAYECIFWKEYKGEKIGRGTNLQEAPTSYRGPILL